MWLPVLFLYILGIIKLHGFVGWAGCLGKKFGTIQPPAMQQEHKQPLFPSAAAAVLWLSCPNWELFCLSMTITLIWPQASVLFLWKGFLIHQHPCEETTILGQCLRCIKTHVIALSEPYTQTQFINRCGKNFFIFSLQRDVTFGVCGVSVREQKVAGEGHSVCRRIPPLSRGKKRGKPAVQ